MSKKYTYKEAMRIHNTQGIILCLICIVDLLLIRWIFSSEFWQAIIFICSLPVVYKLFKIFAPRP